MVHASADRFDVRFDDERAVFNAGLVLPVTLGERLGIERLVDETVDRGDRAGAARPGWKVLSLVYAMLLGADAIDDCDVLRAGRTGVGSRSPTDGAVDVGDVSCARLRSATSASSTACSATRCGGRGRRAAPAQAAGHRRRLVHRRYKQAPGSATPTGAAITRCWPRAPTPARCCTSVSTRAGQHAARRAALRRRAADARASRRRQRRDPDPRRRGLLEQKSSRTRASAASATRSAPPCTRSFATRSTRSPMRRGSLWPTTPTPRSASWPRRRSATSGRSSAAYLHDPGLQGALFAHWRYFAFVTNRIAGMHLVDAEHRQHAVIELVIPDLKAEALTHFVRSLQRQQRLDGKADY